MSGHSKWSTIKRQKGAADAKRGQTFTKIANNITLAVKLGNSGDPSSNPRLRIVMDLAREANMPKENITRAIDRGLGKLPGQIIEEVSYEGFGPNKVAFLLEGITDNKLRTLQEIKNIFERHGGSLANSGAVSYMFDKVGEIRIEGKHKDKDEEMLELIDLGAEDVEDFMEDSTQKYLVYVNPTILSDVANKLSEAGFIVESFSIEFKPNVTVEIKDKEQAEKVIAFAEKLEEQDDIHKVYANFDIPEDLRL